MVPIAASPIAKAGKRWKKVKRDVRDQSGIDYEDEEEEEDD